MLCFPFGLVSQTLLCPPPNASARVMAVRTSMLTRCGFKLPALPLWTCNHSNQTLASLLPPCPPTFSVHFAGSGSNGPSLSAPLVFKLLPRYAQGHVSAAASLSSFLINSGQRRHPMGIRQNSRVTACVLNMFEVLKILVGRGEPKGRANARHFVSHNRKRCPQHALVQQSVRKSLRRGNTPLLDIPSVRPDLADGHVAINVERPFEDHERVRAGVGIFLRFTRIFVDDA